MRNQTPKKRILLRGAAAALALCMVLGFTACGKKKAPAALRVDLSGRVNTLDPQYCTTTPERCLIKNCMEGLIAPMPRLAIIGISHEFCRVEQCHQPG